MKKIFIVLAAVIITGLSASCQVKVTEAAKKAFAAKFPGATNLKWEKESADEYEASFILNNTNVTANFKQDGSWVETEMTIHANDLPAAVIKAINTKYPGNSIISAEKLEKPDSKLLYETIIKTGSKKKTLEINPDGSFVK